MAQKFSGFEKYVAVPSMPNFQIAVEFNVSTRRGR
jgi:hypothetical protein